MTSTPWKRKAAVAAFAAIAWTTPFAAGAAAIGLAASHEHALQTDPSLRAADAALLAGREKAVQGAALTGPQLALSASLSRVDSRVDSRGAATLPAGVPSASASASGDGGSSGAERSHRVALQFTQPLYDMQARAGGEQLRQQTALAETAHRQARQDLVRRVAEACFDLQLAQESLRVARAEKAAVGLQRERAQARFEVGRGKATELQEAQARYDGVLAREVAAESTLALREAQYRELTGVPGDGLAGIGDGFVPTPPSPDDLGDWQRRAQEAHTRVLTRRSELAMAVAEIDKYRLSGRPTLDLVASVSHQGQGGRSSTFGSDSGRSASIGLQLTVPLYTSGALDSRLRESLARRTEAEESVAEARRDARLQAQDAFLSVKTGVSRVAALAQSVRSAGTALEATTLGRDLGTRTELDVLDAQQRLYASHLDLAQARHDYLMGRIRLEYAAGELDADDLRGLDAELAR